MCLKKIKKIDVTKIPKTAYKILDRSGDELYTCFYKQHMNEGKWNKAGTDKSEVHNEYFGRLTVLKDLRKIKKDTAWLRKFYKSEIWLVEIKMTTKYGYVGTQVLRNSKNKKYTVPAYLVDEIKLIECVAKA